MEPSPGALSAMSQGATVMVGNFDVCVILSVVESNVMNGILEGYFLQLRECFMSTSSLLLLRSTVR